MAGRIRGSRVDDASGFYVQKIASQHKAGADSVNVGDILVAIGGQAVREETFGRDILLAEHEFSVTVLRGGERLELTVEKETVFP